MGNWRRPAQRVPPTKGPSSDPSSSLSLRRSSPASRSFVLAPLRALHLDPGSARRAQPPRGRPLARPRPTAQRPPLRGDCLDRTSGFTHGVGPGQDDAWIWSPAGVSSFLPACGARRTGAAVNVERPAGRTTLTAARTAAQCLSGKEGWDSWERADLANTHSGPRRSGGIRMTMSPGPGCSVRHSAGSPAQKSHRAHPAHRSAAILASTSLRM